VLEGSQSQLFRKQVTCTARFDGEEGDTVYNDFWRRVSVCLGLRNACMHFSVRKRRPSTRNGPLSTQSFIGASHATGSRPRTYSRREELHLQFCSAHCQSVCPSRTVVVGVANRQSRSRCLKVLHGPALMRKHCDTQEAQKRETKAASQLEHRPHTRSQHMFGCLISRFGVNHEV